MQTGTELAHQAVLGVVVAGVLALTAVQVRRDRHALDRFLGGAHSLAVVALAAASAVVALEYLLARSGFELIGPGSVAVGAGIVLIVGPVTASVAILSDLGYRFPEEMNVRWPDSALAYPVVGFVAEVAFHLAPLTAAVAVGLLPVDLAGREFWQVAVPVAMVEVGYQAWASTRQHSPIPLIVVTAVNVLAIGLVELHLFRRYGFVTMYGFRLVYYALWHVAWGHARLRLLL